ncbi:Uncharacterized protein FKW44_013189 [Caligus rogercresseyi]|uniref:KN motif and ankyrin repeat domain-containing protein 1 n=1 Tax=Caligus rogercresseyi TaxID=217165 RepID=A0A7T8K9E2_CALRO|nr:Uncharacterized protein FKW44_013189 [Caligus rogercresseyi]
MDEGIAEEDMKITNGNYVGSGPRTVTTSIGGRRFEIPLPFGYHMDLDFLRYCSEELVNGENLERLKDLKRTRRRQRKTLEALMGIKQEQKDREKRLIRDLPNTNRRLSSPFVSERIQDELDFEEDLRRENNGDMFMKEALNDAVRDFERCVAESTLKMNDPRLYNTSNSASHTFPRSSRDPEDPKSMDRQSSSNSSISSVSSYGPGGVLGNPEIPASGDRMETESILSISSEMSASTLRNIREQMARSLAKLKDYEKQVEAIPVMQVKLSVLKEEKRLLMLQLKQKELEMTRSLSRNRNNDALTDDVDMLYDSEEEEEDEEEDYGRTRRQRRSSLYHYVDPSRPRARSESPFGRLNPEEFISYQRHKRSNSCGYNSDDSLISPVDYKSLPRRTPGGHNSLATSTPRETRTELNFCIVEHKKPPVLNDSSCNTESPRVVDHGVNTTEVPLSSRGTNTLKPRMSTRATKTTLSMEDIVSKEESERHVQEAIFKTEEELMECPLLQKAMARVEEEVIRGGPFEKADKSSQVGDENLRPFVIDVGLQADLKEDKPAVYDMSTQARPLMRDSESQSSVHRPSHPSPIPEEPPERPETISVGVGDSKVYEEPPLPSNFRHIGICTEKWVEVIKASKQTDTDDFAYKDTESPRVADILSELPSTFTPPSSRKGSNARIGSPSTSRRSSSASSPAVSRKTSRTASTNTEDRKRKSVGTSPSMVLPLKTEEGFTLPAPGRTLNLCDKCNSDIKSVAKGIVIRGGGNCSGLEIKKSTLERSRSSCVLETKKSQLERSSSSCILESKKSQLERSSSSCALESKKSQLERSNSSCVLETKKTTSLECSSGLGTKKSPLDAGSKIPRRIPENPDVSKLKSACSTSNLSSIQESPKILPHAFLSGAKQHWNTSTPSSKLSTDPLSTHAKPHPKAPKGRRITRGLQKRRETLPHTPRNVPKESDKLATPDRNVVRKNTYTKEATGISMPEYSKESVSLAGKLRRKMGKEEDHSENKGPIPHLRALLSLLPSTKIAPNTRSNAQVTNAINIVQQEWFKTSSTKASRPLDVEDYLEYVENISKDLLDRLVNLTDVNGNTALHYSVSHGNFDVVSILLDSTVANPNILNKAGYTCIMLISLAQILSPGHRAIVERLFTSGDVNVRASQHGQTAIMLAVSHGRLDMVRLLVDAGGEVNVRDEDGSTALMCAAEHGHMEIVKYLLLLPDTNVNAKDTDGLTALAVAMEAGHRDIGVLLYASMSFSRGTSPYSSMRLKRPSTPSSRSPVPPTPPLRSRRNSSNQ